MQGVPKLVAIFTDFGIAGPYHGQMEAVLADADISQPVIRLLTDAPACDPKLSSYLLAALANDMPKGTLFISVVDPGVGSERHPIVLKTADQWFVGPDNGLLSIVAKRSEQTDISLIEWTPSKLSHSFHGRDLFSPVAAAICNGEYEHGRGISPEEMEGADWPDDLHQVIYTDSFGNAITGLRASLVSDQTQILFEGEIIPRATTFSDVAPGSPFWYENSNGLVEIAVNQGNAYKKLGIHQGCSIYVSW